MTTPRATYRIQFRKEFPFAACAEQAAYLAALGVSHVYASPILTARAGSAHGYDVVRYDAINPELGGEAGFRAMASALRQQSIGIILDIVPNHVAVGGADNPMWLDCLKHGRSSMHARWFDIDFDTPDPELSGKIHAPFLGEPLSQALSGGKLELRAARHGPGHEIWYGEHAFPVRPEDDDEIARDGVQRWSSPEALRQILDRQHYVLDYWRHAGDRINWRRFFDITQLAAIRVDEPAAFDAAHAIPLALYGEGLIDGLRVDHIDGLADPAAYCAKLRAELDARQASRPGGKGGRGWLVVEKILAPGERLPAGWDVEGTTGYDFMDQVSALQHDPGAGAALADHWVRISGRPASFQDEEALARRQVLDTAFDGQRERLVDVLVAAAGSGDSALEIPRAALRRAVTDMMVAMRAYRGYVTGPGQGESPGPQIEAALAQALSGAMADRAALTLVADVLSGRLGDARQSAEALRRFNQLSAPLAAKAVEDTAFYRYGRLLSRNDVGFDAAKLGLEPDGFHALMRERAASAPRSLLATATHDHKRGEDVRARLAVLSEMPQAWFEASDRWRAITSTAAPHGLDAADIHMFHQMLAGSWPLGLAPGDAGGLEAFAERLSGWWVKALREGKLRSSWAQPDEQLERDVQAFVKDALDPGLSGAFLHDVADFVRRIERPGASNGLVQAVLRCMVPGIPDIYQGTELWDFSLVDPDNRRPVDFGLGRRAVEAGAPIGALLDDWRDGRIKLAVVQAMLQLRKGCDQAFVQGSYVPLPASGTRAPHLLAFLRTHGGEAVLVLAARCVAGGLADGSALVPPPEWWGDTCIVLPGGLGGWSAVVGPGIGTANEIKAGDVLQDLPIAVWTGKERAAR